jgi:hypothetical protein
MKLEARKELRERFMREIRLLPADSLIKDFFSNIEKEKKSWYVLMTLVNKFSKKKFM